MADDGASPCRLWEVGTWREVRQIADVAALLLPRRPAGGRRWTRARSSAWSRPRPAARWRGSRAPTCAPWRLVAFSPDGSRLVVTTNDRPAPAVHVWDLRAIRRHLAGMGLDWDAPAYSEDDPASHSASPLPPLQVDFGTLAGHLEHFTEPPQRCSSVTPRDSRAIPTTPTPTTIAPMPWPT